LVSVVDIVEASGAANERVSIASIKGAIEWGGDPQEKGENAKPFVLYVNGITNRVIRHRIGIVELFRI
jgi:hypothetical protein